MKPEENTPQPENPENSQQNVVHITRAINPEKPIVSPEIKKKHDLSIEQYPLLNLSEGEFVISAVRRHWIGLFVPIALGTFLIATALTILTSYDLIAENLAITGPLSTAAGIFVPTMVFIALVGLGMFIVYYVYVHNKFFLTNESVIQEIQLTLFSRLEQTVSLSNIEDASFTQHGILQHIINYGDIRLSTEGDETTYRFSYVASPKDHVARLNNAVEAFKNGRPVSED